MATKTETRSTPFERTALDNGLRVVSCEMRQTRSVAITVFIGVGSRYERAEQAGVSHFIEHMLFKGTARRPAAKEISEAIEGTGGILNAGTEHEMTVYWCKVARPHFSESLDLLMDMLRNSLFEPSSIETERLVILEELNMVNDYPGSKVDMLIDQMLWPDHPLGRDIAGTRESIGAMTRDDLLEAMALHYTPSNIVVSVAGSVTHEDVVRQVEELTEGWQPSSPQAWTAVSPAQSPPQPQSRLEYRKTEQTHVAIAVPGLSLGNPDRFALDLLSVILGEGMSSRLFVEVREKNGLAYDIQSGVTHFMDCGALIIGAGVDPKRVYEAIQTILEQTGSLRDSVPEDELEKAKRLSTGRLLLRMEDTRAVSAWMGNQELLMGDILDPDEVVEMANAVTTEDVHKVANDLLVTERLNMAVVGPCRGHRRLERLLRL